MKKERMTIAAFVLPVTILILLVIIYPMARGIIMGFTNYNLLWPGKTKFIGTENFIKIFTEDRDVLKSLMFSLIYSFFSVILSLLIGMIFAVIMNKPIKGKGIFRALLLLPWATSTVVSANIWIWILNSDMGLINNVLKELHIIKDSLPFLSNKIWAQCTVIGIGAWKNFSFMMLVILAGLQSISPDLYESAQIDGGGRKQVFFRITLPLLKPVILISVVLITITTFNNFDLVYLLTKGGPINATTTIPISAYNTAFYRNQMGYASAISVIMMICMMVMSAVYMKLLKKEE